MRIRLRHIIWPMILLALFAAGSVLYPHLGPSLLADSNTPEIRHIPVERGTQPTYAIDAGIDGEVFPAFANYASLQRPRDRQFGVFNVTVTNSSDRELTTRLSVQVPGWSDLEIQKVTVAAGEVRILFFAPVFLPRLYTNHEIAAATAVLKILDDAGKVQHTDTIPVRLRSIDDIYWGKDFKFAPFIASWVTPHDSHVEAILAKAKEFMPGRRLPGYEDWKAPDQQRASTYAQAKAIYRAVQKSGLSYVKSSLTFGRNPDVSERVRMPRESLSRQSANCIDGVVMYASLFENLGMDTEVVLVPGHAYVAVRDAQDSSSYLYLETAITGRAPFETAVRAATKGIAKWQEKDIMRIRISQAREAGIFPMPLSGSDSHRLLADEPPAPTTSAGR